jgi:hypothetical protein
MAKEPVVPFKGTAVSASNVTSATLLAPASNTNGVLLYHANMSNATGVFSAIFLDTAAPSSEYDTTKKRFAVCAPAMHWHFHGCLYVPPGVGIYFKPNGAGVNNSCHIIYEAL